MPPSDCKLTWNAISGVTAFTSPVTVTTDAPIRLWWVLCSQRHRVPSYTPSNIINISDTRKRRKYRWFRPPTSLLVHMQWWSNLCTHRSHIPENINHIVSWKHLTLYLFINDMLLWLYETYITVYSFEFAQSYFRPIEIWSWFAHS